MILKTILIGLPALIHVYIFVLESFLWGRPRTNQVFGVSEADVAVTKGFAFNQGFYNLFLALAIIIGLIVGGGMLNPSVEGRTLILFGLGSIDAAGLVLLLSAPKLWRSACIQILPATVGILALFLINI